MQIFWEVEAVHYGIVQVENTELWENAGEGGKKRLSEREKERKKSVAEGRTNEPTKERAE